MLNLLASGRGDSHALRVYVREHVMRTKWGKLVVVCSNEIDEDTQGEIGRRSSSGAQDIYYFSIEAEGGGQRTYVKLEPW